MPKFFVKQPDGRFALFSTVVEDFHESGMCEMDMRALAASELNLSGADLDRIIEEAKQDRPFWGGEDRGDGMNRWRETVTRIATVSGPRVLAERLEEMGLDAGSIPEDVDRISVAVMRP